MAFKPLFLVTQLKNVTRPAQGSEYTGSKEREPFFKVGLIHGYFPGVGVNFFYETKEDAGGFSLWQIYDPGQIMESVGVRDSLIASNIQKTKIMIPSYGGESLEDAWRASFNWSGGSMELWSPEEEAVREYTEGKGFEILDIFGTLPSIPFDIGDELQAKAFRAQFAQADALRLKAESAQAKLEAEIAKEEEVYRSPEARKKRAAEAAKRDTANKATSEAARQKSRARDLRTVEAHNQKAAALEQQANDLLHTVNNPGADQHAIITEANRLFDQAEMERERAAGDYRMVEPQGQEAYNATYAGLTKADAMADNKAKQLAKEAKEAADDEVKKAQEVARAAKKNATNVVFDALKPSVSSDQWHTVTNGGATGYYDGEFYTAGSFDTEGQWFGTFLRG